MADSTLVDTLHPSANFGPRRDGAKPTILLLHYTGVSTAAKAISWLANPASEVSCHYVIDDDGRITQMVAEEMRAWHAGAGSWAGNADINSSSIGIEIQNVGHEAGYPPFPKRQIAAVIGLCQDIIGRHGIRAERVLAHSDIAPKRKKDPGERFPWDILAKAGIGHWIAPVPCEAIEHGEGLGARSRAIAEAQTMLADYGYSVPRSGTLDVDTEFVITAFQRHFRPARVDGRLDTSTFATLKELSAALQGAPRS